MSAVDHKLDLRAAFTLRKIPLEKDDLLDFELFTVLAHTLL